MVLKRRGDGKMWKDSFNFNFFVIMSGLLHLMLFVTCEPVCYTCLFLDESNRYMKMVDCDGTDKIFMQFASSKDVKLDDLLHSPCGYPEDYPFTHENAYKDLPCGYPEDYPFTHENAYKAITCQDVLLPTVNSGVFNCSGNSIGDKCNLICDDGYYPYLSKEIVCKEYDNNTAKWTVENFECFAITCQDVLLPTVNSGVFDCSGHSIGDKCNLICDDGYYPYLSKEMVCKEYDNYTASWTVENFECFECNEWNEWHGSEYKFTSTAQPWEECQGLCQSNNSDLVTIEDKVEDEFVLKMVYHCNEGFHVAIGLNDIKTEGIFEWSDGTISSYRKWAEGEPNGDSSFDCVIIHRDNGEWYNWSCAWFRHALCERNNSRI